MSEPLEQLPQSSEVPPDFSQDRDPARQKQKLYTYKNNVITAQLEAKKLYIESAFTSMAKIARLVGYSVDELTRWKDEGNWDIARQQLINDKIAQHLEGVVDLNHEAADWVARAQTIKQLIDESIRLHLERMSHPSKGKPIDSYQLKSLLESCKQLETWERAMFKQLPYIVGSKL